MSSNSPGGIYEILGRDLARPENRYLSVPLIRLITSGRLPKEALKDYAILRWPFQARADLPMMITHVAFYGGWPCAMTAANVAREVFEENE